MNKDSPPITLTTKPTAVAGAFDDDDTQAQAAIKPLTRDEARALVAALPKTPYHWVIVAQLAVGALGALVAWLVTGRQLAAGSALAGGLIAAVPAMLMLYGVTRSPLRLSIIGPLVWLLVKLAASLMMFMLAVRALGKPEWPVLLLTLIVALKMYWIVALVNQRRSSKNNVTTHTN